MAPVLAYWDVRGLCEPIRYLLHYKGVDFEDKRYTDRDIWTTEKFSLGLDFPNLPYYIDGELRLSQSLAILRHLARKYQLAGSTENERVKIELFEQQLQDFRMNFIRVCYNEKMEELKDNFEKSLPDQLKLFATFLGKKNFFMGDSPTYVDFIAYDVFDFHEMLFPDIYKDFPTMKNFLRRIENLPQLQSYLKSGVHKRWPIIGPLAKFGGGGQEPKKVQ